MKKAYQCLNNRMECATIIYAESLNEATGIAKKEFDNDFESIEISRLEWADNYKDIKDIPLKEYFKNGWFLVCKECGEMIDECCEYKQGTVGEFDCLCDECRRMIDDEEE